MSSGKKKRSAESIVAEVKRKYQISGPGNIPSAVKEEINEALEAEKFPAKVSI